ncbi:MAG TPA: four helix bundle protein [Desulfuromonas sp.]|nr:four helix bundle protein [Desulfuromonas sp.]HBT82692.1 four helix bundle protein [Desulfuromonas sp.]
MNKSTDLILPHGGYRKLRSFVVSLAAYDGTVIFCNRFIDKRSRTHDQMVQAARSGVQNIAEGSLASGTSKKTELKLTGVARASLGELIRDYEDYLRQNNLAIWDKDAPKVKAMRARLAGKLKKPSDPSDQSDQSDVFDEPLCSALRALKTVPAEVAANIMLCLSHQATFLLARQMERLESDFVEKGGFTERLYKTRSDQRGGGGQVREESDRSDWSDKSALSDF